MSLSIVLLAAGEGKRMKTNLPKPLVMLGSDPLVQHSLNTIKIMKPEKTILVTGFKKDEVKKYVLSNNSGDFILCYFLSLTFFLRASIALSCDNDCVSCEETSAKSF